MDLSAIEAILNSPTDSQRTNQPRAHRPCDGTGPNVESERGGGRPRNALLGSAPGSSSKKAAPKNQGAKAPSTNQDGALSARALERFRRVSTLAPRTAFLSSPVLGPRPHQKEPATLPPHAAQVANGQAAPSRAAPKGQFELDPNEPLLSEEEINAFFSLPLPPLKTAPDLSTGLSIGDATGDATGDAASAEPQRPAWLKNQIADLADLVQALDLQARANHAHVGLESELSRLRQFTRTMGFVASPPPKGLQEFDIATLVEEALGAIAGATPNAPRILFRKRGDRTETVADKVLVAAALDALLQTAVACAGSGDVVRITVEGRSGEPIVTEIEFPPGPIAELHPDRILTPYALRKILPNIGPNALAAAGAIAVGQGGDMSLTRGEDGTSTFLFELQGLE